MEIGSYTGLGNQIFQYCILKILSKKFNMKIYIKSVDYFCLNKFYNLKDIEYTDSIPTDIKLYEEKDLHNISGLEDIQLSGYYQKYKYYIEYKDYISNILQVYPTVYNNIIYEMNKIKMNKSLVIVHIRMPDLKHQDLKDFEYNIITPTFLDKCIYNIKMVDINTIFICFSNDIKRCKSIYKNDNLIFYDGDIYDYYRIMLGDYSIISPSSYSWWPVFLNKNIKQIYSYKPWFNINRHCNYLNENNEIYGNNWIIYEN